MKIAIVDDWLTNLAGKDRVTLTLHKMFPDAPIYTSAYNPNGPGMEAFADADVRTSFIQRLPWAKTKHQLYPILRRFAFPRFDFSEFDLVISSSGAEAKGIKTGPNTTHISYIHSPTHYYWVRPDEYLKSSTMGWLGKLLRFGLKLFIKPMRRWDYLAAQNPDVVIANSSITQRRIKQFYDRDAEIIFPPVDVDRFNPPADQPARTGLVTLGRQVHYMRRDLAVEACTRLGLLLRVIGRGPEHEYLRSIAGHTIEFYENLSDEEVAEALWYAEGVICPGVEDFGITAVEALAAGAPVIAINEGGSEDILTPATGITFAEQTVESLTHALKSFKSSDFKTDTLTKRAEKFSRERFVNGISNLVQSLK